jgi:hypothetical protein
MPFMKNKSSDLEKVLGFILSVTLFVTGGCLAIFLLTTVLRKTSGANAGAVIAVAILGIGFYFFIKPNGRKRKHRKSKTESYSDSRLDDLLMKRIYAAYNVKEEPESEEDDSADESDEDADSDDNADENAVIYYNHDEDLK